MKTSLKLLPVGVLLAMGCVRENPVRVEDRNLGIVAVFPGQPRMHKFSEPTPFGDMEWFSTTYETPGRLDRSFFIDVGNLPPGDRGGATESAILASLRRFLTRKMGKIDTTDLPAAKGAGFSYKAQLPNGEYAEGIAVLRRGRIHRAQATVAKPDDPQLKVFLGSFEVMP
jgi:hypothetical protein